MVLGKPRKGEKVMSEKVHNLTDSQLQAIIRDAIVEANQTKTKAITPQNIFNDVKFNNVEIGLINRDFPNILELLGKNGVNDVFCNTPRVNIRGCAYSYTKLYQSTVHDSIRKLTLNVFGKTLNTDLTRDEYDLAQEFYSQLVDWYLSAYKRRLKELYKEGNENG